MGETPNNYEELNKASSEESRKKSALEKGLSEDASLEDINKAK